jgi:hypothetical protein
LGKKGEKKKGEWKWDVEGNGNGKWNENWRGMSVMNAEVQRVSEAW